MALYTAFSILQLLWYLDRRKTRRYHEERERIIAYAEMSEHLHEAMDAAAQIIEDHVDYMDPTDYFTAGDSGNPSPAGDRLPGRRGAVALHPRLPEPRHPRYLRGGEK